MHLIALGDCHERNSDIFRSMPLYADLVRKSHVTTLNPITDTYMCPLERQL